jgi:hypothetical protein
VLSVRHDHLIGDVPAHETAPPAELGLATLLQIHEAVRDHQALTPDTLHRSHLPSVVTVLQASGHDAFYGRGEYFLAWYDCQ